MTTALANQQGKIAPLASIESSNILARYHTETVADIAQSLGVSDVAVYLKLLKDKPDEWKEHQAAKALADYELAEKQMKEAPDPLSLSRARELVRSMQWKLERVCRRIYGQDQPPAGAAQVAIQINLRRSGATDQHENVVVQTHAIDSIKS